MENISGRTFSDYSGYHQSASNYHILYFKEAEDTARFIKEAFQKNKHLRVRGNGHSMNGISLPRENEYLLHSKDCTHFKFEEEGTVTVGAGSAIWDVNIMLKQYGYELYVFNDGNVPAASVGGYVSAGGFGERSFLHGGFWETVEKIILINGKGELIASSYGDGLFQWLFGSMGQLGLIFEVKLRIKPLQGRDPQYPLKVEGNVSLSKVRVEKIAWYSLFTTVQYEREAYDELVTLDLKHKHVWKSRPLYKYNIAFKRFNPPLLFPSQQEFEVLGIWGTPGNRTDFNISGLRRIERDFSDLISSRPYFRRYVQTEFLFRDFDYSAYFNKDVFLCFRDIKHHLDPKWLFGKGIFK